MAFMQRTVCLTLCVHNTYSCDRSYYLYDMESDTHNVMTTSSAAAMESGNSDVGKIG